MKSDIFLDRIGLAVSLAVVTLGCSSQPVDEGEGGGGEVTSAFTAPLNACVKINARSAWRDVLVEQQVEAGVETTIRLSGLPFTTLMIGGSLHAAPDCSGEPLMVASEVEVTLSFENPYAEALLNFVGDAKATVDATFEGFNFDCMALLNGGFEDSEVNPGGSLVEGLPVGDTRLTGWSIAAGNIDLIGSGFWSPSDGAHSLDMSGFVAGAISQPFGTVPGARYEVRFDLSGEPYGHPPVVKELRVAAADASQDFAFDSTLSASRSNMHWREEVLEFTATSDTTTLTFTSLNDGDSGPALDHVRVTGPCQAP